MIVCSYFSNIAIINFAHTYPVKYARKIFFYLANLYWKAIGGLGAALMWAAAGTLLTCTLIFFPAAVSCYKNAYIAYKPFGRNITVIYGKISLLGLVWTLTFGAVMAFFCMAAACASCAVIAGVPTLGQWSKLIKLALFPYAISD